MHPTQDETSTEILGNIAIYGDCSAFNG